jgi:hypothetical protein
MNIGLYPILGFNSPLFGLFRVVDSNNQIPRGKNGELSTSDRGIVVVDRFISAYEIPNEWTLLKDIFGHLFDLIRFGDLKEVPLRVINQSLGDHIYNLFRGTDIGKAFIAKKSIEEKHFSDIYALILNRYFENSIRLGMPSSSWMLKVRLPFAGKLDAFGILRSNIPLESGREGYVLSKSWKVKYSPEEMPFTNFNIIGSTEEVPKLVSSNIRNRVLDSLRGKDLFGPDNPGYIYSIAVISPKEFFSMISAARSYSIKLPKLRMTFQEIVDILSQLHIFIEEELDKSNKDDASIITLFALKTGIPLSEISEMVKRAKEDFIDNQGIGLKKILYSAFINPQVDFDTLPTKQLEDGLKVLQEKEPFSPAFMVSPGNITLYDSFYLFAQLLFPTLTNQDKNTFTIYIRPSESDITFNFLVFKFFEIALQVDPKNEKGLQTLIQKAYWDPRYDEDFLSVGMENAEVGMYYGTAKTYTEARFRAAISRARKANFIQNDIDNLLEVAGDKNIQYNNIALEKASKEGIDSRLIQFVSEFINNHKLYPETLNATIIMPDSDISQELIEGILTQTISLRGADCTNTSKVWVPKTIFKKFMESFELEAGKIYFGDIFDPKTKLAQYDTDFLKTTKGIIYSEDRQKDTKVIPPTNVKNGKQAEIPIDPNKNYTGVIVTEIEAESLISGDPIDRDTYLRHLAGDLPLPWINFIIYDTLDQAEQTMKNILSVYSRRTGYPRYLYVALLGNPEQVESFQISIEDLTDLIKTGEEAFKQFTYYRPHQGSFFINDLVK